LYEKRYGVVSTLRIFLSAIRVNVRGTARIEKSCWRKGLVSCGMVRTAKDHAAEGGEFTFSRGMLVFVEDARDVVLAV